MEDKVIPNPNGANGTTSDPREDVFWELYVKNNLENAYKCALEAGYTESTATTITTREWFKERLQKLRRKDMLSKAERNLDKALDTVYLSEEGKIQPEVMRIVMDVSKTVASTLGKEHYSTRTEQTGKDGKDLVPTPILGGITNAVPEDDSSK